MKQTILGLKRATHEINEALDIVCESYDLAIAQVWIPYDIENHVPSSSSLEGTLTRQKIAFKLTGSCVDLDDDSLYGFTKYYDTCDMLPLNFGDGLVGKALQTYEPHFCRYLYDMPMTRDKKLLLLLSSSTKCSCLAICLRSIDTRDIDYAFEFLWPRSRNYFILLESLLLTLKSCLPSFKFASGEQLGDELRVVDVENSTGSGIGFFKIFEGNRISQIHKALGVSKLVAEDRISSSHVKSKTTRVPKLRKCTRKQIGRSMNEDAVNDADYVSACNLLDPSGLTRPTVVKRNLGEYESQSDSNDDSPNQDDDSPNQDILIIKFEYADDVFTLNLPIPLATLAVVKKEINKRCKLNPETYKLKYLDEDEDWILMTSEEPIMHCIECQRTEPTPPAHSSPPPVPSPLLPSSGCPTQIQTLRIASTQALIDAVTAALPSPPLPPLPPSLYIPPPVDRRDDIPESEQPPRKRLCLSTLGSRYEIGESSTARPTGGRGVDYGFVSTVDAEARRQGISEVGYGIRDTWVDPAEAVPEIAPMTVGEVNTRVTELAELHEHDTQDLYALLEDAQDRDSMDGGGGGLCFSRGLGSLDRIESGDSSGASDPS
ncbi:NIN-like protein [Tanacetum coccineum]